MHTILTLPRDAWRLGRPFFWSEQRWSARMLLLSIIVLNLAAVGMDVIFSYWNRAFYNTLQTKDFDGFINLLLFWHHTRDGFLPAVLNTVLRGYLPGFVPIATLLIFITVTNRYLSQWLTINWRQWMTTRLVEDWLSDRAYYRISLTASRGTTDGTDNPDQRIAEDVRDYVEQTLSLGIDFMSNIVSLGSFVLILWSLSGDIVVLGITIPAYLIWVSLLYAAFGTACTHLIGRPLVMLRFMQQKVEADYRFSLVRVRENVEAIALSGGERQERNGLGQRFQSLRDNWWAIMQRAKLLNIFINGFNQISVVFPFAVVAPRFFAGTLDLGGLTQTAGAFSQVQGSMSWFVTAYSSLASLRAIIDRLNTFQAAIAAARAHVRDGVSSAAGGTGAYTLQDATLRLPDGTQLLEHGSLSLPAGQSAVITGRSGSGKSTLFRALAGIWPFGSGHVQPGAGVSLFLPQRPYFPLGSLRDALAYPREAQAYTDEALREALKAVGLQGLVHRLGDRDNWGQILSGGEQQRLSLARAVLIKPDWLFLDEATASLDPEAERGMLAMLKEHLPHTTLISIAHRPETIAAHQDRYVFERPEAGSGQIVRVSNE